MEPLRIIRKDGAGRRARERTRNNPTTTGFRVSEAAWAQLRPLLPSHPNRHRFGGGRQRVAERACADAIIYVLRTGCQWQALDQTEWCARSTALDRFQEWVEAGVFLAFWRAGVERFDELRGIDWSWLSMDGAMTKVPLGGGKIRPHPHRSREGRREAQRAHGGERRADRGSDCQSRSAANTP